MYHLIYSLIPILFLFLAALLLLTYVFRKKISAKRYNVLLVIEVPSLIIAGVLGVCLSFFTYGGMGASNWDCDNLPGNYEIWMISARNVKLVLADETGVTAADAVPAYVFKVGYTDTYIFAQQANVPEDYHEKIDKKNPNFYIVEIASGKVFGPYNKTEFSERVQQLGMEEPIEWMSLNTLRKTPYVPGH